jgi:exosortase/archaeosortase family protein
VAYDAKTTRRRLVVLLAAAPVAIAVNVLRVFGLILLALWQGFDILETFVHPASGLLTFVVALPIIYWLGHRRPMTAPAARPEQPSPQTARS